MILLIDNYDSFTFNLFQAMAALGREVKVVRNDRVEAADIRADVLEAIVLSPGPGRPERAGQCIGLTRSLSGKVPILGVCLGHQAIAAAFGGQVVPSRDIAHGKDVLVFHNRSTLYRGLPLPFSAGRYHSLVVEGNALPECLAVEAETPGGLCMCIRHREHPTFGVQFHPESVLTPEGGLLIRNFLEVCDGFQRDARPRRAQQGTGRLEAGRTHAS